MTAHEVVLGAVMPTDRVRVLIVILFLASLFLGSLAGCGGGGGHPGQVGGPEKLQAVSGGSLAVTIANLPSGAGAAVRVTGPGNFTVDLAQSQTLGGIAPGSYTVAALQVVAGAATWIPFPATQDVTVVAGAGAAVRIDYAVQVTAALFTR
jgi:hypothetical protein